MKRTSPLPAIFGLFAGACLLLTEGDARAQVAPVVKLHPVLGMNWTESDDGKVVVAAVEPESPAAKAGVHKGDVVVAVNGTAVTRAADLEPNLHGLRPGQKASLRIQRREKMIELTLVGLDNKVGLFGAFIQLDDRGRVKVMDVAPGTPAAEADIRVGDVLLSVQGHTPTSLDGLMEFTGRLVSTLKPGVPVAVQVGRDETQFVARVVVPAKPQGHGAPPSTARSVVLGVAVKERGPQVVVTQVIETGPAANAGIRPDDVIVAVGRDEVTSYATLVASIKAFQVAEKVPVQVMRAGQPGTIVVTVIPNDTSISDVVLDSTSDVLDVATEVKQLKQRVAELSRTVEYLTREVEALRKR